MIMKHKIDVPKGCKVVSVEIISVETTDKMAIVKFEKEEPEFKENDIVYTEYVNHPCISIINFFEGSRVIIGPFIIMRGCNRW